ncbi:MAG: TetR/AcrR family transcriptional regulator [Firmicutes bacterium]|nr:TetR/AcrR family transcriptional regulator [Bacillota bacterium]
MPPKPKCTREEIAAAALSIIKERGLLSLTARELGKRLGTTATPVFTVFENMEEVKMAARELALQEFQEYLSDFREYSPAFKRIGMMMVSYGMYEPELFKLLFMQEHREKQGFQNTVRDLGDIPETCVSLICRDYGISREDAVLVFEQLWTFAFGLGAMCAMGVCTLPEEEIGRRLGTMFAGTVMVITSGKLDRMYSDVENNTDGTYHGKKLNQFPFAESQGESIL